MCWTPVCQTPGTRRIAPHVLGRPALVARIGLAAIAALIPPGTLAELTPRDNVFELDDDWTLAALLTFAILLGAAAAAVAWAFRRRPVDRAPVVLAALLVALAVDELTSLHQHVETAVGVNWELVYALPAAAAAACAFASARGMPGRLERRLMAGAGLLWLLAQALDHRPAEGSEAVDDILEGAEEIMELCGSLLIWLSFAYAYAGLARQAAALHTSRAPS
jgi:peptidoglycan/LPS O-acetylase OafA/YrhL